MNRNNLMPLLSELCAKRKSKKRKLCTQKLNNSELMQATAGE
jgi:hypothetical protein